jgi:hypothetical protein
MTGLLLLSLVILVVFAAVSFVVSRQRAAARAEEAASFAAAEEDESRSAARSCSTSPTTLGYIARSCISRSELSDLIDPGISPDDLADRIARRISEWTDSCSLPAASCARVDVRLTSTMSPVINM